jgi:hypothetical protein
MATAKGACWYARPISSAQLGDPHYLRKANALSGRGFRPMSVDTGLAVTPYSGRGRLFSLFPPDDDLPSPSGSLAELIALLAFTKSD